jgi:hypothetical protein
MKLLLAVLLAWSAVAQPAKHMDDADQKELYNYVLTMDKIQKAAAATQTMTDYGKKHPELNNEKSGDAKNLDEMVKKLEKFPEVVSILSKNGLTPREYAVCFFTLLQASIAVGSKRSGLYKEYPPKMLEVVSRKNLDFVDQHFDEIQKLTNKMQGADQDQ